MPRSCCARSRPARSWRPARFPAAVLLVLAALVLATPVLATPVLATPGLPAGPGGRALAATATTASAVPVVSAPSAPATADPRIVLVGAAGLGWSDVGAGTPGLAALLGRARRGVPGSAVGSLSVRSAQTPTCPVDGWSTISAGARATGPARPAGRCPGLPGVRAAPPGVRPAGAGNSPVGAGQSPAGAGGGPGKAVSGEAVTAVTAPRPVLVTGWAALRRRDSADAYRAPLGTLGDAVARSHRCLTAVGPGAALAGARSSGLVERYLPDVAALDAADIAACPLTLVDAGAGAAAGARTVSRVLDLAPDGTTIVVATTADGPSGDRPAPALGLIGELSTGLPAVGAGHLLTSDSTDWPGIAALTDLTPTLLAVAGVPRPTTLTGAVITAGPGAVPDLGELRTTALRARVAGSQVETWFTLAGLAAVGLVLALAARSRWPRRWPAGADRVLQVLAGTVFCLPVSTRLASLIGWWRAGTAGALWAAQLGSAIVLTCVAVAAAQLFRRRAGRAGDVVAVLAAVSTLVVVADVAVGSPLSRLAVIGLLPIDGSRFHGLGNEIVAAVDTAVLLGASIAVGPLVRRRRVVLAGWLLAAAGLLFAAVDGLPGLGDDFGGIPAAVVGAGVSGLVVAGSRLRPARLAAVAAAAAVIAGALALGDAARGPGRRTHIGDFVADLAHGTAGPLISRKVGSVVGPFLDRNGPIALVAVWFGLAVVVALGIFVLRPGAGSGLLGDLDEPWPAWRAGLAGSGAAALVGAALNDSGIIVALVATGTAVAAVTALLAGAAADRAATRPGG